MRGPHVRFCERCRGVILCTYSTRPRERWHAGGVGAEDMRGSEADLVTTAIVAASRFPFPQSLQKSGNCYREVHRLSRFRDHRTACSCLMAGTVSMGREIQGTA